VVQALAKARLPMEGGRVLVLNGSGAVGHLAVQLAKVHYKATVTATTGPGNQELVRNLGADRVLDYTEEGWASKLRESGQQFDAIVDLVGGAQLVGGGGQWWMKLYFLFPCSSGHGQAGGGMVWRLV
jgi:NADPH:quinone reductase-like Zn-dependent oxidoreductase